MEKQSIPLPKETQPELFDITGQPNPEVVKTLKQIEDATNEAYIKKFNQEIEDNIEERHRNHAP
jgi:hypothetical protein